MEERGKVMKLAGKRFWIFEVIVLIRVAVGRMVEPNLCNFL